MHSISATNKAAAEAVAEAADLLRRRLQSLKGRGIGKQEVSDMESLLDGVIAGAKLRPRLLVETVIADLEMTPKTQRMKQSFDEKINGTWA